MAAKAASGKLFYGVAQTLAGLEYGDAAALDGDLLAGARVASFARLAITDVEAAEWNQLNFLAFIERLGNLVQDGLQDVGGLFAPNAETTCNALREFKLGHDVYPPADVRFSDCAGGCPALSPGFKK